MRRIIQILVVKPGEHPAQMELPLSRSALENVIGVGDDGIGVARVHRLENDVYLLYNDELVPLELEGNRRFGDMILAGTFCIIAADGGFVTSLPDAAIQKYKRMFWEPEAITYEEQIDAYLERSKMREEIVFW